MRRRLWVVARLLIAAFCWLTAAYAFVTSSAFAYLQFVKPRVFRSVGLFSDTHAWTFWFWFGLLLIAFAPEVRRGGLRRTLAVALAIVAAAAGIWNTIQPVLPSLTEGSRSAVVGVLALLPLLWLALVDHVAAISLIREPRAATSSTLRLGLEGRLFVAAAGSALFVVVIYAVLASFTIARGFEPDLMAAGLAFGVGMSLLDHFLIFVTAFLVLALLGRFAHRTFLGHYLLLVGLLALMCSMLFVSLVAESIGLTGWPAALAAAATGASIASTWGGLRLRRHLASGATLTDAIDVFVSPPQPSAFDSSSVMRLAAVVPLAYGLFVLAVRMDWDFAILKAGVVLVWVAGFVAVCRVTPLKPLLTSRAIALVCVIPLGAHLLVPVSGMRQHVLERYAVHNPSFLLADGLVRSRPVAPSFDRFLRAHTGLTDISVSPISIDLVPTLAATTAPRPLIFLLAIDSLRADYLSPYNPAVGFTPRIQEFASDSLLFTNAFTRYGGTGLSMPAIWAGSAIIHKQYVHPFAPMNALEKLLDTNGYRKVMSRDHITDELWTSARPMVELDRGRNEMDFDFCGTLDELGTIVRSHAADAEPIFAQTRSLNLHVAAVRNGYVPPGKSYPGFEPPYAWRVERMDACFGGFIDLLKRLNLYDRSVIVLTADHGELIGEDGRWGHSYHMFPEVIQIPLLVHVPSSIAQTGIDRRATSLSTDITPTLYDVLGYDPVAVNDLIGRSLLERGDSTARRRDQYVLAASYGAVYAVVSRNGRRLYIADAIKGGDYAYQRHSGMKWTPIEVTPGARTVGQQEIRRYVDELSRLYHVERRF